MCPFARKGEPCPDGDACSKVGDCASFARPPGLDKISRCACCRATARSFAPCCLNSFCIFLIPQKPLESCVLPSHLGRQLMLAQFP